MVLLPIRQVVNYAIIYKSHLTKSIELLSLLKGQHSFVDDNTGASDWADFWHEYPSDSQYTLEEVDAMCDAAEEKEKCREYNMREAEYYNKRAQLDAEYADPYAKLIKEAGGYEWTP